MANDAISKVLGPDRGHIRAFGFGVTTSNFSLLSKKDDHYAKLEEKCEKMEVEMTQMRSLISHLLKSQGNGSDQLSNATMIKWLTMSLLTRLELHLRVLITTILSASAHC
ncbi:uncharacterized protein LOC127149508 [Cucumis melo]|uniref:Uncharacterized protein LOC127149508 n=1 Tax=Cucumis melo TaxID=3656 RepID=A0ABM3KTV7_CUCME|nr:uncharacterized protein LOC127149508 [Cucumis melo]